MSRPTEQTIKCLQRDLDWLLRIRKRARANETRSERKHEMVMKALKVVVDIFQDELDREAKSELRKEARAHARSEQLELNGTGE